MGSKGEEGDARLAAHNTTMCIGDDWGFLDGDVAKSRKLNAGKFCALSFVAVVVVDRVLLLLLLFLPPCFCVCVNVVPTIHQPVTQTLFFKNNKPKHRQP